MFRTRVGKFRCRHTGVFSHTLPKQKWANILLAHGLLKIHCLGKAVTLWAVMPFMVQVIVRRKSTILVYVTVSVWCLCDPGAQVGGLLPWTYSSSTNILQSISNQHTLMIEFTVYKRIPFRQFKRSYRTSQSWKRSKISAEASEKNPIKMIFLHLSRGCVVFLHDPLLMNNMFGPLWATDATKDSFMS